MEEKTVKVAVFSGEQKDWPSWKLQWRARAKVKGFWNVCTTTIHEDNRGCLFLANAQQPTKRTRHVAIKQFMLQDWVETDQILMSAIDTQYNISDAFTKSLGRIKFYEQYDVLMGRCLPPYAPGWIRSSHPQHKSFGTHVMEKHVCSDVGIPPPTPTTDYESLFSLFPMLEGFGGRDATI